jgi:hypothetical protein
MKYPSDEEVQNAEHMQLGEWMRFLPSPGIHHIGDGDDFQGMMQQESAILKKIAVRFEEAGGWTPTISKSVGWENNSTSVGTPEEAPYDPQEMIHDDDDPVEDLLVESDNVSLSDCFEWMALAIARNATHRKRGIKLQDTDSIHLIARIVEELGEVSQAITRDGNQQEELGDLLACIMHLCMKEGFTQHQISSMMITKLEDIFGKN